MMSRANPTLLLFCPMQLDHTVWVYMFIVLLELTSWPHIQEFLTTLATCFRNQKLYHLPKQVNSVLYFISGHLCEYISSSTWHFKANNPKLNWSQTTLKKAATKIFYISSCLINDDKLSPQKERKILFFHKKKKTLFFLSSVYFIILSF